MWWSSISVHTALSADCQKDDMVLVHELALLSERVQRQIELQKGEWINCFICFFFLTSYKLVVRRATLREMRWNEWIAVLQLSEILSEQVRIHDCAATGGKSTLALPLSRFLSAKLLLALPSYKHKVVLSSSKDARQLYSSRRRRFTKNKLSHSNLTFELAVSRTMIHTTEINYHATVTSPPASATQIKAW